MTVTGLTNGQAYTFTVTATNGAGTGPASGSSAAFTPVGVPGAPSALRGTLGDGQVFLAWDAPTSDGGAALAGYKVTVTPAIGNPSIITINGPTTTTRTVEFLTNGTAYTFTVAAFNVLGAMGAVSNSVTFTPMAPFVAPAQVASTVAGGGNSSFFLMPDGSARALGQNFCRTARNRARESTPLSPTRRRSSWRSV